MFNRNYEERSRHIAGRFACRWRLNRAAASRQATEQTTRGGALALNWPAPRRNGGFTARSGPRRRTCRLEYRPADDVDRMRDPIGQSADGLRLEPLWQICNAVRMWRYGGPRQSALRAQAFLPAV